MGCPCLKAAKFKKFQDERIKKKVVIVGLDGTGKTAILHRIKTGQFVDTTTTIGLNMETIIHKDMELLMFDVGGKARSMWSYYFENVDAIIFVVDCQDKERLGIVREEIIRVADAVKNYKCVFLLYLNKQDLKDKLDLKDIVKELGVSDIDHPVDFIFQKSSALTGEGVMEGLDKMTAHLEHSTSTIKS
jgi:small GTP-binding protein domain